MSCVIYTTTSEIYFSIFLLFLIVAVLLNAYWSFLLGLSKLNSPSASTHQSTHLFISHSLPVAPSSPALLKLNFLSHQWLILLIFCFYLVPMKSYIMVLQSLSGFCSLSPVCITSSTCPRITQVLPMHFGLCATSIYRNSGLTENKIDDSSSLCFSRNTQWSSWKWGLKPYCFG